MSDHYVMYFSSNLPDVSTPAASRQALIALMRSKQQITTLSKKNQKPLPIAPLFSSFSSSASFISTSCTFFSSSTFLAAAAAFAFLALSRSLSFFLSTYLSFCFCFCFSLIALNTTATSLSAASCARKLLRSATNLKASSMNPSGLDGSNLALNFAAAEKEAEGLALGCFSSSSSKSEMIVMDGELREGSNRRLLFSGSISSRALRPLARRSRGRKRRGGGIENP
ncbi:hypothetical protein NL676_032075 [Syzygium grande]|nr:hypothetical protein NL676_032075 [Syzygium grande]